jgi:hypothetical protein
MVKKRMGRVACRTYRSRPRPRRWGEKLGAPRMWLTAKTVSAPVLSRSVDVPPRRVWRGRRTILSWAMQPARMAQIRRDPASEVVSVSPRRDFRPTGSWVAH